MHALQDAFDVRPISASGKDYRPPKGKVDPSIDIKTALRKQVNGLDAEAFFDRLTRLTADNRPHPADQEMVARMEKIGLVPAQVPPADAF